MLIKLLFILLFQTILIDSSCECLKCTEKGVQDGLCGCSRGNECGYQDKTGSACTFCKQCWYKGKCGNVAQDGSMQMGLGYLNYYSSSGQGGGIPNSPPPSSPPPPTPPTPSYSPAPSSQMTGSYMPNINNYNNDNCVLQNYFSNSWVNRKTKIKTDIIPKDCYFQFNLKWDNKNDDPFFEIGSDDFSTFSIRPVYNSGSRYGPNSWRSIVAYRATLNSENNYGDEMYQDGQKIDKLFIKFGDYSAKIYDGINNFTLSHSGSKEYLSAKNFLEVYENTGNISILCCNLNNNCSLKYYSDDYRYNERIDNIVIAEKFIPKWSMLEFKLQTYERFENSDSEKDIFLRIFNCDTLLSWIKFTNKRVRVCLNKNNNKNNNNAGCHSSQILQTNTEYTIRIYYDKNSVNLYVSRDWRSPKLIGTITLDIAQEYLDKESYLEYIPETNNFGVREINIETKSCDNLPKKINEVNKDYCEGINQYNKTNNDKNNSINLLAFIMDYLIFVIIGIVCLVIIIIILCIKCCKKQSKIYPIDNIARNIPVIPQTTIINNNDDIYSGTL